MNPRKSTQSISQKLVFQIILVVSVIAVIIATGMSYYILVYKPENQPTNAIPTTYPTATPTPSYFRYMNRPATYVGTIESVSPEQIILLREDSSRVVLTIQGNVPVYSIQNNPGSIPNIVTRNASSLTVGDTLSVYAEDKSITALFLSN